jgi:hypothetical protein
MAPRMVEVLPLLAAAVLAVGCWDAPIRETLELDFHGDGSARATLAVGLDAPTLHGINADDPVRKRLVAKAAALEDGSDPWLKRFDVQDCPRQGGSWQRDSGDLTEYRRFMECPRADAALELLAGANLGVSLREDEGTAELAIEPLGAGPAPAADRERALAALDEWAGGLERYYAAAFALARRATERPELARDLWIVAFADDAGEPSRELAPEDAALAADLRQALDESVRILRPRTGEAETADELSRRVFDPLPARLVVTVPVEPVASSGFLRRGERRYAAPERGFYAAFARLEGRWLAADPLVARVERGRAGSETPLAVEPFCVAGFLRADAPPKQAEIRGALLAELEARTRLELTWKGPIEVEEVAPPESAP